MTKPINQGKPGKLAQLQNNFIDDCLSGPLTADNTLMANEIDTQFISAPGLMGIYQHSAIANITNALSLSYPVIEKLVGQGFFKTMCREYILKNWPESGNMDDYGGSFAKFLVEFEQVKQLSYLDDVARFEWLFHQSSLADDSCDFDWSTLAKVAEADILKLNFLLSPSVKIIHCNVPVDKIWQMNQPNAQEENELIIELDNETFIVLFRQGLKTEMMAIVESEFVLLQSFEAGQRFEAAIERAKVVDANISIDSCLQKYIQLGLICGFSL